MLKNITTRPITLILVEGPTGSGKSTWIDDQMRKNMRAVAVERIADIPSISALHGIDTIYIEVTTK